MKDTTGQGFDSKFTAILREAGLTMADVQGGATIQQLLYRLNHVRAVRRPLVAGELIDGLGAVEALPLSSHDAVLNNLNRSEMLFATMNICEVLSELTDKLAYVPRTRAVPTEAIGRRYEAAATYLDAFRAEVDVILALLEVKVPS